VWLRIAIVLLAVIVALGIAPASAATNVSVHGDVVTITVPIDCVGCKGKKAPNGNTDLAQYWEQTAEQIWNQAFENWPYCGKYKLELDVEITARGDDFGSREGRHRILVGLPGSGLEQTGWDGAVERTPEGDAGQRVPDGTRYFENDGDGAMPADVTPTVLAHEFGHVIGLGDDRDSGGNALPNRAPPGATPTIMVGGARLPDGSFVSPDSKLRIDKALIDRIGNQLVNLGKIKCGEVWKGHLHQDIGPEQPCVVDATFTLIVRGARATATPTTVTNTTCPGTPATLEPPLSGTKTRDGFLLDIFTLRQTGPRRARGTLRAPNVIATVTIVRSDDERV